jgi:thioredoxin-dependent peroxiredoxin
MKRIQEGDKIPQFILPDQNGKIFDVSEYTGRQKLVLFFYPLDNSIGCTKEACYFRDLSKDFSEVGAAVAGISSQSVDSHKDFAKKNHLTYPVLSDVAGKVRKQFGVPSQLFGLLPGRVTYVADMSGKIVHIFNSQSAVMKHVDEALEACRQLDKSHSTGSAS